MGVYKDQEDMFRKRAEKCTSDGDRYYAMSKQAQADGDEKKAEEYMKKAQHYYQQAKENEQKAEEHKGKSF